MASRFGKIPTTSLRLRISRLSRSCGLFDQIWRQCSFGKVVKARSSSVAPSSTALAHQIIALKQETELLWRARYFDIDLGTLEILPINDAFCSDTVIRTVNAIHAKQGLRDLTSVSA